MNHTTRPAAVLLVLASLVFTSPARADDKKKMWEWQQKQQQMLQEWKLQEVQRQQQLLRQQQANQRKRTVIIPASPWGVNQNGRGSMNFTGGLSDRLNFAVVTLTNFYDGRGGTKNSGPATVTLYGGYSYPLRGTWTMHGNLTVGLSLTPSANALRGDRAVGNLTMTPPNGARLSRITLTGVMTGNPFTANFSAQ